MSIQRNSDDENQVQKLVTFKLADQEFGLNINNIREIVRLPEITEIPRSPVYVAGIANLRGDVLPVIDTRLRFTMKAAAETDRTRMVVVDISGKNVGLVVDAVSAVMEVKNKIIEPPPKVVAGDIDTSFLDGVVKLDNGSRLIMALNPDRVCEFASQMEETDVLNISGKQEEKVKQKALTEELLVVFTLDREEFGIRIMDIQEINRLEDITKVPGTPEFVAGVINLRGNVIPVIDLRRRFGMETKTNDDATRVVIIDLNGRKTGLIVDKVNEVIRILKAEIDPPPEIVTSNQIGEFIDGIGKLEMGRRILILLNVSRIITSSAMKNFLNDNSGGKAQSGSEAAPSGKENLKQAVSKATADNNTADNTADNASAKNITDKKKIRKKLKKAKEEW